MILRRFVGNPSYDLNEHDYVKNSKYIGGPISTVIGWVKAEDDIFNFSFHEVWKTQNTWLHDLIAQIIHDQFGVDIKNIFPMPGWGQSVIFGFLHDMGYTDYDSGHLPIGDANLLREGITRETESSGLASNISITLETAYEIKYVNDIDPTIVFHQIINNLLTMGTENIKFLFKGGSTVNNLLKFVDNPKLSNLINMVKDMVTQIVGKLKKAINGVIGKKSNINESGTEEEKKKLGEAYDKKLEEDKAKTEKEKIAEKAAEERQSAIDAGIAEKNKNDSNLTRFLENKKALTIGSWLIDKIIKGIDSVLTATIARYKWPLRGAVAQATGMNMTPWHLTIGNPASPILSMNQIKVDSVDVKLGNELMFNDLPKHIYATIKISNTRSLGKQEILRFFGVNFKRKYSTVSKKNLGDVNYEEPKKPTPPKAKADKTTPPKKSGKK
jgi:hypothetical protein